jgi:neutral ceramidase
MQRIPTVLTIGWFLLIPLPTPGAEEILAGAARIDITPPTGHALWGYAARKDTPSDGVLDPLLARALVLGVGKQRLVLVSLDLGRAPTRTSTATIREQVKKAGIQQVFLVASHTHNGPVLELDNWPTPQTSYVRQLERKLVSVILDAARDLRPARIGVASREVGFNRNRHSRRPEKPVDRELLVLRVEDTQGKPIAHAVNFAAHPTLIDSHSRKFSADYPGTLAALVEKETSAPCLFLQGAAGDLSPNTEKGADPGTFGKALGNEVLDLARTIRCKAPATPSLGLREEPFTFSSRFDLSNPVINRLFSAAFFPDLVAFYEREYRNGIRPQLGLALLDGRIAFVGVSGEFFCGHSLSLKRRARLEAVFFLGYCNDYHQYFPTIEAASEGGYGADFTVSPVEIGAGERVMDRALINLYQLRGLIPGERGER